MIKIRKIIFNISVYTLMHFSIIHALPTGWIEKHIWLIVPCMIIAYSIASVLTDCAFKILEDNK